MLIIPSDPPASLEAPKTFPIEYRVREWKRENCRRRTDRKFRHRERELLGLLFKSQVTRQYSILPFRCNVKVTQKELLAFWFPNVKKIKNKEKKTIVFKYRIRWNPFYLKRIRWSTRAVSISC
jgi:hypothetical protein